MSKRSANIVQMMGKDYTPVRAEASIPFDPDGTQKPATASSSSSHPDQPQYDEKHLMANDKALVDYWIARHWHPPGGPSHFELINDFMTRFIGADKNSKRTVSIDRRWPMWMIDTLAMAWKTFRQQKGINDFQLMKEHPGGELFLLSERPIYGQIETDYKVERTELLFEQCAYMEPTKTNGFVVKFDLASYAAPRMEILTHEKNRESAEKFVNTFAKLAESFNLYRGKHLNVIGGRIKFAKIEPASFDHIIMNKRVIDMVRSNTVELMERREQLRRFNVGTSHATILAGKPGTGKTLLGRAVATALGSKVTTWIVTAKAFYGASDVTTFYEMVRAFGPAFVLFEDIDLVGRERISGSTNEVLGELLNQMSGTSSNEDILTIASTNDLSALDAALSDRPERIGTKIDVPLPGPTERRQMLEMFASKLNSKIEMNASGWSSIVSAADGLTGDYMRALVRLAVRNVISKMKEDDKKVTSLKVTEADMSDALGEILRSKSVGQKQIVAEIPETPKETAPAAQKYTVVNHPLGICTVCMALIDQKNNKRQTPAKKSPEAIEHHAEFMVEELDKRK